MLPPPSLTACAVQIKSSSSNYAAGQNVNSFTLIDLLVKPLHGRSGRWESSWAGRRRCFADDVDDAAPGDLHLEERGRVRRAMVRRPHARGRNVHVERCKWSSGGPGEGGLEQESAEDVIGGSEMCHARERKGHLERGLVPRSG
eukprot:757681-Hanusia_phi.AAC.2